MTLKQSNQNTLTEMVVGVKSVKIPLFRLPQLLNSVPQESIFIVEGEKDVPRMEANGFVATCNVGGAGKWKVKHAEHFKDRDVVIILDNDESGRQHAQDVAQKLHVISNCITIPELTNVANKENVSHRFDTGGKPNALLKIVLRPVNGPQKMATCKRISTYFQLRGELNCKLLVGFYGHTKIKSCFVISGKMVDLGRKAVED